MPLSAALQARLAKRGLLQAGHALREPEEEIIAEDYDDQMHTNDVDELHAKEKRKYPDEVAACPNKWNVYHECNLFCSQLWEKKVVNPFSDIERLRKRMLKKHPLPEKWEEIYDCGTGRHYYWHSETDEVSWLSPTHPKAKIGPSAAKLRRMIAQAEESKRLLMPESDGESNASDSSEEPEEKPKKVEKFKRKERDFSKGRKKHKDNDLDPMDPASYSEIARGSWSTGLEGKGEAKTGVDSTASGPLFQMRPYPSPGAILRANASNQK